MCSAWVIVYKYLESKHVKLVYLLTSSTFFLTLLRCGVEVKSGAPNENIVQNHLNITLLNVF